MNRTGAFLSVIEWPRTLRYISWIARSLIQMEHEKIFLISL